MGCIFSSNTAVQPLRPEEVKRDEDETGSKPDGRGDSAVSKGTADSGVVMEDRQIPALPGQMPRKLPPLPGVRENELDRVTQDGTRPKSREILEELLNQGIIPVGQQGSTAGEAYSIMLDEREGVRRRPPSRLQSLKANKAQSLHSREKVDEKMRLVEMRRQLREDELKTRLRTKSARVRAPVPTFGTEADEDAAITPVERIQHPLTVEPSDLFSQVAREEAEGEEHVRETLGDGRECREETGRANGGEAREEGGESGENRRAGRGGEDGDGEEEEELTQVEDLEK